VKGNQRDYTVKELAKEAGVNPSRIRQLLGEGTLKGAKRAGAWFIPADVARAWLASRRG
jgi:hypothetical protein